jgi:hypothetical protein
MTVTLKSLIKAPHSNVYRKAFIKRRLGSTGLFDTTWEDISRDVKSYGKITNQIDATRLNKLTFGNAKLVVENSDGRYNPHSDQGSLWYGYLNQQRTLVKIEAGYKYSRKLTSGIYLNTEFPLSSTWDNSHWDADDAVWDANDSALVYTGIISGDIVFSDTNDVVFNIKPLQSIFQEFPARNLTGWTSTGMTGSQFVTMVRDQTDGAGSFIFRPFFDNTTTNWDISTTSNVLSNLNTSTAKDIVDKNVWEVIEKIAEAENFVPYVSKDGIFKFISRTSVNTTTAFEFHGAGSYNTEYGHTIKKINSYAFRLSKYYSRVQVKFRNEDTASSYYVQESTLTVSGLNNPWILGNKTLSIENYYIANTATASTLVSTIFSDISALKHEVEFETTFIPHLDLFDRITINYDPNPFFKENLWDQNNWAYDNTSLSDDLIFDSANYDSLLLSGQEFKFLSFELDLDNFQNKIIAREI